MATMTEATITPSTAPAKGVLVTEKALTRIRSAMAKEGISPEQGGLRLGVQGGGCSGLSYNIRFDTQPRERDRIFQSAVGIVQQGTLLQTPFLLLLTGLSVQVGMKFSA